MLKWIIGFALLILAVVAIMKTHAFDYVIAYGNYYINHSDYEVEWFPQRYVNAHVEQHRAGRAGEYAHDYARMIGAGHSSRYSHAYAEAEYKEEPTRTIYAEQVDAGMSKLFASAYAYKLGSGESEIYAYAYAEHINEIKRNTDDSRKYADVLIYYAKQVQFDSFSEQDLREYAEQVDKGKSKIYALAYVSQLRADKSEAYAEAYAGVAYSNSAAHRRRSLIFREHVFTNVDVPGALYPPSASADTGLHIYAEQIEAGRSREYAWAYMEAVVFYEYRQRDAREYIYARVVDGRTSRQAAYYAEQVDADPDTIEAALEVYEQGVYKQIVYEQAIAPAVVLAMYSTTDDAEAGRRASSVRDMTTHVERGDMDAARTLDLLNDIAPEASIDARAKAADRLASISDESDGELTPQQSMEVANEVTRLITGYGIDAEQRSEAAREMVRLSQSGELNADNAVELMDDIAPEWSVSERKEALGYLAWQFYEGEWDADSTKRTAEEGYRLITGDEIQLEKRIDAGVDLMGTALKRYGGDSFDDESIDQATELIKMSFSGDLNADSVSKILGIDYSGESKASTSYDERYAEAYAIGKSISDFNNHASAYATAIVAGRSHTYARAYAHQIAYELESETYAKAYAWAIDAVYSPEPAEKWFAHNYARVIEEGKSHEYALAYARAYTYGIRVLNMLMISCPYALTIKSARPYAEQIVSGKSEIYAIAYAEYEFGAYTDDRDYYPRVARVEKDDYHPGLAHLYAEQIDAGKSWVYGRVYVEQITAGKSEQYADKYARAYAHAVFYDSEMPGEYHQAYAKKIAEGKSEQYAHTYAVKFSRFFEDIYPEDDCIPDYESRHFSPYREMRHSAEAFAEQVDAGKSFEYAEAYAEAYMENIAERKFRNYAHVIDYAHAYAEYFEKGKSEKQAEILAEKIVTGHISLYSRLYIWGAVLIDWLT